MTTKDMATRKSRDTLGPVLGIVPARGGSKGIKYKNIVELHGKPLIAYTLEAIQKTKHRFDYVVSTDDKKIRKVAEAYGGHVPYLRPHELAQDRTNIIEVIKDILKRTDKKYRYVLLLQPTAPLRRAEDIDAALAIMEKYRVNSVCSFTRMVAYHPWYMYYLKNKTRVTQVIPTPAGMPRQRFPEAVWRNGAIYLVKTSYLLEQEKFVSEDCRPYLMPVNRSVNIDTLEDLRLAEYYLKNSDYKMATKQ